MRPQSHLQLDVCTGGACAFSVCEHMGLSGKNFSCLCPTFLPYRPPVHWSDRVCISFSICQDVNVGLVLGPPDGGSSRTLPPKRQHGSRDTHPPGRLASCTTYIYTWEPELVREDHVSIRSPAWLPAKHSFSGAYLIRLYHNYNM